MPETRSPERIEAIRSFNRFYTRRIGVLQEGLLRTPFSLTEARVIYELAQRGQTTATRLGRELDLDAGYLSRLLGGLQKQGLIDKQPSEQDGRQYLVSMTKKGMRVFGELDATSRNEIEAMLAGLSEADQARLLGAMQTITSLLGGGRNDAPYVLRTHRAGDMGWVVRQHGLLYNHEYGWTEEFEALVAELVARFIRNYRPDHERCWIAERDGEPVGCVFLVRKSQRVARLRMLLVDPKARGSGLGKHLVRECTRFARQAGYRKIVLWTNSVLDAARHIYEREGYRLTNEDPHHSFGHDLVGQNWELEL